eukprot:TRINITY_DN26444_c0_g1_i5.p4 TRINITY_DN26444_c0_g1~~TRINITY_DN26444_c0_g1_i5.p4  ORF type:complete len:112 (+),score=18.91 TRINITY_DN26444_c0_g1_i5:589-924(+)
MSKQQIFSAYRTLRRASLKTFQGDEMMLAEGAKKIREAFESYRLETDPGKIEQLLKDAADAAEFLRTSIVQAKMNERGSYELKIDDEIANDKGNYVFQTPSMDLLKEKRKD